MEKIRHVAVNTRFLLKGGLEGIGRYTFEILNRMVRNHPDVRFSFFFDRPFDQKFVLSENVKPFVLFPPARHPVLFRWWLNQSVAGKLRSLKPDVFFSPDGFLSTKTSVPQVAVFHDLAFMHYPQDVKPSEAKYYHKWFPAFAEKATRIIAVSEFTKSDIIRQFQTDEEKITVIHNGCSENFHPVDDGVKKEVRKKYSAGNPFFVCVGAIQPRKNLERIIAAFSLYKKASGSSIKLLLVGRKAWNFGKVIQGYQSSPFRDEIIFTGFVTDEELNAIYSSSLALCYVPYFEGFGFPVLEATKAETAVITSMVTSIPEVAGDAALLVDPMDINEISRGFSAIASDQTLRNQLVEKGKLNTTRFSWNRSAEATWEVLEAAAFRQIRSPSHK